MKPVKAKRQLSAPMAVDGTLADASKWTSEYDSTAAKLQHDKDSLVENPVAGISTANHTHNPTMFAWDGEKGEKIADTIN